MVEKSAFEEKSIAELVKEAGELVRKAAAEGEMTDAERIEYEADGGYFQEEDD